MRAGGRFEWLAAAAVVAGAAGCAPRGEQPAGAAEVSRWPAGTVLAVGDRPISLGEIDAASAWIEPIEPHVTSPQLRRLALTNVILPRVLAEKLEPERREEALRKARVAGDALRRGDPLPEGTSSEAVSGNWQELGIPVWGTAIALEDDAWSDVIEGVGEVFLVRRRKLHPSPAPLAIRLELDVVRFPYIDAESGNEAIERAYDEHALSIVDPAWREIVPELIQYRMGVHSR